MEDLNTEILELNTEEDFKKVVQLLIPIKEFVLAYCIFYFY